MLPGFDRGLVMRLATRRRFGLIKPDEGGKDVRFYAGAVKGLIVVNGRMVLCIPSHSASAMMRRVHCHVWYLIPLPTTNVTTAYILEGELEAAFLRVLEEDLDPLLDVL